MRIVNGFMFSCNDHHTMKILKPYYLSFFLPQSGNFFRSPAAVNMTWHFAALSFIIIACVLSVGEKSFFEKLFFLQWLLLCMTDIIVVNKVEIEICFCIHRLCSQTSGYAEYDRLCMMNIAGWWRHPILMMRLFKASLFFCQRNWVLIIIIWSFTKTKILIAHITKLRYAILMVARLKL